MICLWPLTCQGLDAGALEQFGAGTLCLPEARADWSVVVVKLALGFRVVQVWRGISHRARRPAKNQMLSKYLISACVWNKGWDKVSLVTYKNEIEKIICTVMLDEICFEWANINISGFALMRYSHTKIHIYVCEHTGTCRGEKKKCHCSIPTGEEPFAPDN